MGKIFNRELAPSEAVYDGKMLDPREIRIDAELNGRHECPPIDDLVADFLNPAIGQIQPVLITKDDDGAPLLKAGNRRWRAAMEVTRLKQGPYEGVFRLKCQYVKGSPLECFVLTIKENLGRVEALPIDDGYNISRLRVNFGMSHEDIALKVYGRKLTDGSPDVKWVKDREALSDLAAEAAEAVTGGRVKPSAVLELAKLSKTAQRALLKSTEGKITTAVIKRATAPTPQSDNIQTIAAAPAKRKQGKTAICDACEVIDRYIGMELPKGILDMSVQSAVRQVLRQLSDDIHCGD